MARGSARRFAVLILTVVLLSVVGLTGCQTDDEQADDVSPPIEDPPIPPAELTVYFAYGDGAAFGVLRTVNTFEDPNAEQLAQEAMRSLLDGPTSADRQTWPEIGTEIPEETRLLGVFVNDGVAEVDLTEEFASGGGSQSMLTRAAQVVYTLTWLDGIDSVVFLMNGEPLESLGGEGVLLEGPQTPEDFYELVPIEA